MKADDPKLFAPVYSFDDQLQKSLDPVNLVLMTNILQTTMPGLHSVTPARKPFDRKGIDYFGHWQAPGTPDAPPPMRIDHKCYSYDLRRLDKETGQWVCDVVYLEVTSGIKIGWTLDPDKWCDWVVFTWHNEKARTWRYCQVPFKTLREVFTKYHQQWEIEFPVSSPRTPWYETEFPSKVIHVPTALVLDHVGGFTGFAADPTKAGDQC